MTGELGVETILRKLQGLMFIRKMGGLASQGLAIWKGLDLIAVEIVSR